VATSERFTFEAVLWLWEAQASWCFVSLPEALTDEIDDRYGHRAAGFGSIKVEVQVGDTVWHTSVFPDAKRGTLVLPVKKDVRRREKLEVGSTGTFEIAVVLD
jgi:hypothetical protein